MAFPTLVPPAGAKFSQGTSENREPKVLANEFGDGYTQRVGDGLNADLADMQLQWNVLTWAEAEAMMTFFRERKGYLPFKFTLPGEGTPRKWIAKKFTRSWDTNTTASISAVWKEVVDPE